MKNTAKITKTIIASLFSLTILSACTEGYDNVTTGTNGDSTALDTGPIISQGSPEVDQFVDTVYNGKDSNQKVTGILYPNCSNCHNRTSGVNQPPYFADASASKAYQVANLETNSQGLKLFDISTLDAAIDSAVVAKVASGHNCWSGSNDIACQNDADELTSQIQAWYNAINGGNTGGGGGGTEPPVERSLAETLVVPNEINPAPTKIFPDAQAQGAGFGSLHTLLTTNCIGCHVSDAQTPQAPYFADASADVSYASLKDNQKIDINIPEKSRLYLRLKNDAHNCWSTCLSDSQEILDAINAWIATPEVGVPVPVPTQWVTSKALTLADGQVVSGGVRYEADVIAKYNFDDAASAADPTTVTVAKDSSGVGDPINLNFNDADKVKWVSGWGVQILPGGRLLSGSATASRKLYDLIIPNSEYSVEAWVVPGNVSQGADNPAVIMAYSGGTTSRNFTLGQQIYNYTLATRLDTANGKGTADVNSITVDELIATPDADEALQATLQHVVVTYSASNGRNVYVNGELAFNDPIAPGILDEWNEGYLLSLGADTDGGNPFLGRIRLLAIHNAALPADKVLQNFEAGVGQKFNLLFKVGHLDDSAPAGNNMHDQSYILVTMEEFDDFSYKIFDPKFVVLGADVTPSTALAASTDDVVIKGMRIGVNGLEPEVGQAFGKLNTKLTWKAGDDGNVEIPQLSNILGEAKHDFVTGLKNTTKTVPARASGTIIPKASGSDVDQFFLTFEDLGGTYARTDPATPTTFSNTLLTYNSGPDYNFSLRNFDEVYATMAAVTGVDPVATTAIGVDAAGASTNIAGIYGVVRQALPVTEDSATFVAAQEVAITRLAFEFCSGLIDNNSARTAFFGASFKFGDDMATAFDVTGQNLMANALANNIVGTGIGNQPLVATVVDMLLTRTDDPNTGEDPTVLESTNVIDETALFTRLGNECTAIGGADCSSNVRTIKVAKSMCMAVLGSAAMLIQ